MAAQHARIRRLTMHRPSTYCPVMSLRATGMREPAYFVLASMLDGPVHGSAIIERAEALSGGRVRLVTGTLYAALDRLTAKGYVSRAGPEAGRSRVRYRYGLTQSGECALRGGASRSAVAGVPATHNRQGEGAGRIVSLGGRVRVGGKGRAR